MEDQDADIVAEVLAGRRDAYGRLVLRHHRRLYYYVVGKVSGEGEAEDIVQRAFVSAYRHLAEYDPNRPMLAWLRTIALNHCRNEWKQAERRARLRGRLLDARRAELELGRLDAETPDERRVAALRECLQRLPAAARRAVQLRFVEELPLRAIGRAMDKNAEAARLFLFRVRARLAHCVKKRLARGAADRGGG